MTVKRGNCKWVILGAGKHDDGSSRGRSSRLGRWRVGGGFLSTPYSGQACGERQSHPFPPESLSLGLRAPWEPAFVAGARVELPVSCSRRT